MTTTRILTTAHGTNREAFTLRDWGLFIGLALIWGSSFLFIAMGLDAFQPGVVTMLRVAFGASFLALIPRTRATRIDRGDWGRVLFLAFMWVALPFTLFPIAQQWIDSSVAGMLNGATPILTAVIATILLRSLPGRLQIAGLVIGFAGILAIALPSAESGTTAAIGVVLVLVATLGYAVSLNVVAPLQQKYGSLPLMARVQWLAVPMVIPFGLVGMGESHFEWASFLAVLAIGVLGTGLAFVMMGTLTGSVGATRASSMTYLLPVVALVLGVVFRDEIVAPMALVGVLAVIAGAILASRREV
ncbi:MAG TPA: DMT family transporter [Acidimicrobiia bacterium]|jgi:drug/metabolite transporter (DMT)-like permease|nr:DMT family transporter [Acidimicrobiia bacterium]